MNLTKRDLVVQIAEKLNVPQQQVGNILEETISSLSAHLASGNNVEFRNFGSFTVQKRKARVGRNPNKPAVNVPIPERFVVKFKLGKELKAQVAKLSTAKPVVADAPSTVAA